jgi:hypothetical protein
MYIEHVCSRRATCGGGYCDFSSTHRKNQDCTAVLVCGCPLLLIHSCIPFGARACVSRVRTYADTHAPSRRLYLELPVPPGSVRVTPYGRTRVSFTDATSIWSDSESSPPSQHLPNEQFSFGGQHIHQDTSRERREHLDQAHSLVAARPASPLRANSQLATPSTPQEARGDEHHLALTSLCDSNAGVLPATLPL